MAQKPRSNRWTGWFKRKPSVLRPFPALRMEELELRDVPAAYTWTGAGATPNWSDAANWISPGVGFPGAPTGIALNNEDLTFPGGTTVRTTVNDIVSGTFNSISFSQSGGAGYVLTATPGNQMTLGSAGFPGTGFINVNLSSFGNDIQIDTTLGTGTSVQQFFVDGSLTISGRLSGLATSGIIKSQTGTLTLSGDNSGFLGTISLDANSGQLVVANQNALGDVLNGTNIGNNSVLVLDTVGGPIAESITLNGPGLGQGTLYNRTGDNTLTGPIIMDTSDNTDGIVFGAADLTTLTIEGVISDTGADGSILSKEGLGTVVLNAANTYRGLTKVNSGVLQIGNELALGAAGSPDNGTIVRSHPTAGQGQLRLASPSPIGFTILDEYLTLNGAGQAGLKNQGSLTNTNADNTWAGPVTLGSPAPNGVAVTIGTGFGTLTISGVISTPNGIGNNANGNNGSSQLQKVDIGTLIFNNENTYACPTLISAGVLIIRDSRSLGTNSATVANGATLQLEVEAGAGPNGTVLPPVNPGSGNPEDAHGRNLSDDSVTHDAHSLQISNQLNLTGLGVLAADGTRVGALYSKSGINTWTSGIVSTNAGIGVALDPRAGHPTPDSTYFVNDYSLKTMGTISGSFQASTLTKLQPGHLILPVRNTYQGDTYIQAGWVTIQNNRSLGERINLEAQTRQPETFVYDGAAVHLRTLLPTSAPLFIDENFILSGVGPKLPYRFISQKGALMNIGGDNIVGTDSLLAPTWFTYVALNGNVGIGVEQIAPLAPGAGEAESRLTILGWTRNDTVSAALGAPVFPLGGANPTTPASGGITKLGSKMLQLEGEGTYSLTTNIKEGIVAARHNTALGQSTSGTYNPASPSSSIPEVYNQTTTIVQTGANLYLDSSSKLTNGGISSGIQTAHEELVLNAAGQQIAVSGFLDPAPTQFFLTFANHLRDDWPASIRTTGPLIPGLVAADIEAELNKLDSVKSSEIQQVTTGATPLSSFTLQFAHNSVTATTPSLPVGSSALVVQNALLGLSSIRRHEVQTVTVTGGVVGTDTFTLNFNGQLTTPISYGATNLAVQAALSALPGIGACTVVSAVVPGGIRYTVTFDGPLVAYRNQNLMTVTSTALPTPIVVTPPGMDGFGGTVVVQAAPAVPGPGTVYTVTFGGDLANTNVADLVAAGTAVFPGSVQTRRDGVNGYISVSESIGPGNGNRYTLTFPALRPDGGINDLANADLPPIVSSASNGTLPSVATVQNGGAAVSEIQRIDVVAAEASYTLTYKTQTTNPIPITAGAQLVENELNALTMLTGDIGGQVLVTKSGNVYSAQFNAAHSADTPRLVATPIPTPQGVPEVTISGNTDLDGYVSQASLVSLSLDNTWRGPVVMNSGGRLAITEDTRINFLGSVTDGTNPNAVGSDLVKRGQGEILLGGLNTFRGTTWVDTGIATVANSGALGTTNGGTTVANNAQLQVQGSLTVAGEALTIQGTGVADPSTLKDKWFNVGPAPTNQVSTATNQSTSARITSVATDPRDPNVIYVSTAGGGAWKSKDRGVNWTPLFDDTVDTAAVMYGGHVVVAPSDPNTIYFATGEANGGANGSPVQGQRDNFAGTGVYVSNNAGVTWRLLTGPSSRNPIYGLAISKLLVDPTNPQRIYVSTGTSTVINGGIFQVANNLYGTAVPGVYRYDGSAAAPDWFNLTALPSLNRDTVPGRIAAPRTPGPDDEYRIMFPQTAATWSDIALVRSGPGNGANPGNTVTNPDGSRHTWVLYAALGESVQRYGDGSPGNEAIFNAVYRSDNPASTYNPGEGPSWWLGAGTSFPVAEVTGNKNALGGVNIPAPTTPDQPNVASFYNIGPESDPVNPNPPTNNHLAGRNEWIKVTAVVTRYYNVNPTNGTNTLPANQSINAAIQVYASNLGNSLDNWSYSPGFVPNTNAPFGHDNELLDIQRSSWDGGLGDGWNGGKTLNLDGGVGFSATPFGVNPRAGVIPADPPSNATGRYSHTLSNASTTYGLLDTTPLIDETLYLGGKTDIWRADPSILTVGSGGNPLWTPITQTANTPADYFHDLHFYTENGNLRMLSGSDGGLWMAQAPAAAAAQFQNLNGNITSTQFNNIDPHPTDINQALAAAYNSGLQRFTGGLAWNGFTLPATGDDRLRDAGDVRYDPKNPLNAFATVGGNLYRTQNGGTTWQLLRAGVGDTVVGAAVGGVPWANSAPVYVDPVNPSGSRVLVGGSAILESRDADAANPVFTNLNGGTTVAMAPAVYQGEFVFDPDFPDVTDRLANAPDSNTIWITDGNRVRITKNRGLVWMDRDPFANQLAYNITFGGNLANFDVSPIAAFTTGGGFQLLPVGVASAVPSDFIDGGPAQNEIQSLVVTAATGGNYRLRLRTRGGANVTTGNIPYNATTTQLETIINAALAPSGGSVIVSPGSTSNRITDIAVDPSNRDTAYITVRQSNGTLGRPTVYRTTDAGRTWQDISSNQSSNPSVSYTNTTDVIIPDDSIGFPTPGTTAVSSVSVVAPPGDVVKKLTVTVNIQMAFDGDIAIYLRGPNGVRIPLSLRNGGSGDDYTATIFDDDAATQITAGTAPFSGLFQPETPLSSFNGIDPNGTWSLEMDDNFPAFQGTLLDWTLEVSSAPAAAGSLPFTQAWTVAVDPRTDTIYIGNDQGVWRLPNASSTNSFNWSRFGDSLPDVQVHDLVLNQTLNTLTASTYGRGMYQLFLTDYQPSVGGIRVISGNSVWNGPVSLTGDLTITADGSQEVQNGIAVASLDILGVISDSAPGNNSVITKKGLGTVMFSGSNIYGGQTLVEQGVLRVKHPNALGVADAASNTIVSAGAALELASDLREEAVLINGDGIMFNGHFSGALRSISGNNVYTGPLTLGSNATIGVDPGNDLDTVINPGVRTLSSLRIGDDPRGIISGNGSISDGGNIFSLDKELAGTLILGRANTIGGEITVNQGAIRVENALALGSTGVFAGTKVLDGAALQIARNAKTLLPTVVTGESLSLSGTGTNVTGALRNVRSDTATTGTNDNTWAGPITFAINPAKAPESNPGTRVAIRSDDSRLPGVIDTLNINTNIQQDSTQGSFGLIKVGPGRLNLMQANSFTGTTEVGVNLGGLNFQGGSLRIENPNSLGPNALSNSVQTLSVVGLTGNYQLEFLGQRTPAGTLNAGSTALQVENALNALSSIGQAEQQRLTVTGAGNYQLTFDGQTTPAGTLSTASSAVAIQNALNALSSIRRPEIQDVMVTSSNGYFTLTFTDATGTSEQTVPLPFNSPASGGALPGDSVQNALNALGTIIPGSVSVAISPVVVPGATVYRVTFSGNTDRQQLVAETYTTDTVQDGALGVPEIQRFALFSTTGTFTLSYSGLTTVPLNWNATATEIQTALNALPSISGVNGSVAVSEAPFGTGRRFTLVYAGSLADRDLPEIVVAGVGGPVTAVNTVQDGLNGGVTVVAAGGGVFNVTFTGDLAARDVSMITAGGYSGSANVVPFTTRPGAGVIVSETPSVGGKVLTVTFQRPLDLAVIPQLISIPVSGLAVNVATSQVGGAGAIVNNTGGPGSIEIAGDPLNLGGPGIDVTRNVVLNGTGVAGFVRVSSVAVFGGIEYTLTFDGALGNTDIPQVAAAGANGASVTPPTTLTDGSRAGNEVQRLTVTGSAGFFTISLNGRSTVNLPFNATAAAVQSALNGITSLGGSAGALVNASGNNTWSGTVTLGTNSHIGANPGTTLNMPVLRDPTPLTVPAPSLTKTGQGTVVFPSANAYGGLTTVRDGVLTITQPQGVGTGRNEVQVVSTVGPASGQVGGFTLTFNGQTTVPLFFNTPDSGGIVERDSVENALNALSSVRRSEVQTVTLSGSALGTFTLTLTTPSTAAHPIGGTGTLSGLAFSTTGPALQAALENLLDGSGQLIVGTGNVSVTRTGNVFTITFGGTLANTDIRPIVSSGTAVGAGGTTTVTDGLGGTVTVTPASPGTDPIPGGRQYTITFGGDLANMNLPEVTVTSAMVFTGTQTPGSTGVNEVQTVETFVTGFQTFSLTFNGQTVGGIPAGASAAQVETALETLTTIHRDEIQDIIVNGTSGKFQVSVTTPTGGTQTATDLPYNITSGALDTALEALTNVGANNVIVTPVASPAGTSRYQVRFTNGLGFRNIVPMVAGPMGSDPLTANVVTIQDGLAGDVFVTLTPDVPATSRNRYTVEFKGDLAGLDVVQMTGTSGTQASFIGARTAFDGNGAETQYVKVTGSNGTFTLNFRGQTTSALLFSASAADVERALNALSTIGPPAGGFVQVTKSGLSTSPGGADFTIHFGGTLGVTDLPQIVTAGFGGTTAVPTTGNNGPEGTTVLDGATLQLLGSMTMDREVVRLNGQGFLNQGALNVNGGTVTWKALASNVQIPLVLDTDASIGTTLPTDNLVFELPITDEGEANDLDIYGPGTVTFTGSPTASFNGITYTQFTGTTTVHEGTLLLSRPGNNSILGALVIGDGNGLPNSAVVRETTNNQIANSSTVRVNSDGLFDLSGFTDEIGNLTVAGNPAVPGSGHVDTGVGGQLTTGFIDMTAGLIDIRNGAAVTAKGDITMRTGASIAGGFSATLIGQKNLSMDASTISFGDSGTLAVQDVTMTASTIEFANDGAMVADDINAAGGHIAFQNNGSLIATGNVGGADTDFTFGNLGTMNVTGNLSVTDGLVQFGITGTLNVTGNATLTNTDLTFANNGTATIGGTFKAQTGSEILFGTAGIFQAGDTTIADSLWTMGDGAAATTANLTATNSTLDFGTGVVGGTTALTSTAVTTTDGVFKFGDNATFTADSLDLTGGSVEFGETGLLDVAGNVSLSGTTVTLQDAGRIEAMDFTGILGSMIEFFLNGILNVDDLTLASGSSLVMDRSNVTAKSMDLTDSSASFGPNSIVAVTGPVSLTGSDFTLGSTALTPSILTAGNLTMDLGADGSRVVVNDSASVLFGNVNATGGSFTADDNATVNVGNVTANDTDFLFGDNVEFNTGFITAVDSKIAFDTDALFTTSGKLSLNNSEVTLGDRNLTDPVFSTQAITMTNGSTISLGMFVQGDSLGMNITGSTFAIGANATHTLGGNIDATSDANASAKILGPGTLSLGGADRTANVSEGPLAVDLAVTAKIPAGGPNERLSKTGLGRLQFAPVAGFTGTVSVFAGDVQVDTAINTVNLKHASATLSGTGTVGQIDGAPPAGTRATGTVSPGVNWTGTPIGILNTGNLLWGPNTTYFVNVAHTSVGAPVPGVDNDMLNVNGTVSLNGAKLDGLYGAGVRLADQFTIIQSTGAITGRFAEFVPNSGIAFIQGHKFSVQYNTNSVVLTKVLANITSMNVASSLNPATQRQPVVLTATVIPESGATAFGAPDTVTFTFTNTLTSQQFVGVATVNVNGLGQGVATFDTSTLAGGFLPGGSYNVSATFEDKPLPSVDYASATATLTGNPLVIEIPTFDTMTATEPVISPTNLTSIGTKDGTIFNVNVVMERGRLQDALPVKAWSIVIRNSAGTAVKTITNGATNPFGPATLHTVIPISAPWDGRDDFGVVVPDDVYSVTANFRDEYGNTGTSNSISVVVDNTTPTIPSFSNNSPNGLLSPQLTGLVTPQVLNFAGNVADPAIPSGPAPILPNGTFQSWTIDIKSSSGTLVRSITGNNPNVSAVWDGKDNSAAFVADGVYTITIRAVDQGGNTITSSPGQTIVVLNSPPTLKPSSNTPTVYGDAITITAEVYVLPPNDSITPLAVRQLLVGDTVEFYLDGTTLLGSAPIAFDALLGKYVAKYTTLPTQQIHAGTYNSMFVRYTGTPGPADFAPGNSAPFTHIVTPATLRIAGKDPVNKKYGDPVPPLNLASGNIIVTTSDLRYTDTAAGVVSGSAVTTATQTSHVIPAGYPITQGSVTANSDYNVVWTDGRLYVTKADLTVTIDNKQKTYHAPLPPFTFTASPLLLGDQPSVVTGITLTTTATQNSPVGTYPITAIGTPTAQDYNIINVVDGTLQIVPVPTPLLVGAGEGGAPVVKVYDTSGTFQNQFQAFASNVTGGVRTATGDFNRDGVTDFVLGTGPGTTAYVRVINGATGQEMFNVFPFDAFTGGVFVSAGDIDGDGADEVVISPDEGGGPRVVAYSGITFAPFISYFGIDDPEFRGGARAAVGDLDGDGFADIALSAGFNGGPRISIWDGKSLASKQFKNMVGDFFAYSPELRNGAYVAIGDIDGDGIGDLITGAGPGGGPHVKIYKGVELLNPNIGPTNAGLIANFFAGDKDNRGGVRVAVKSFDGDLKADLATGVGEKGGSSFSTYLGTSLAAGQLTEYFGEDAFPGFFNGVFVG